jgi:hypothetical protein
MGAATQMSNDPRENYEREWETILGLVQRHIGAGEKSLSRVLRLVEAEWRRMDLKPTKGTSFGETVTLPRAAIFGARQALRTRTLIRACMPSTKTIVELGSGWGNNLLDLYLSGGPADAHYHALEPTRSGRECAKLLANLEPGLHLAASEFDYDRPDYSTIPSLTPHVVVFTSHSIETIPHLSESAITGLLSLGTAVTGVHFEPVGWQLSENVGDAGATREYSLKNRYNENLWDILKGLEREGKITVTTAVPDIFHHKTYNASCLIIWNSGKA